MGTSSVASQVKLVCTNRNPSENLEDDVVSFVGTAMGMHSPVLQAVERLFVDRNVADPIRTTKFGGPADPGFSNRLTLRDFSKILSQMPEKKDKPVHKLFTLKPSL